ncbi:hypothetical protein JYK14_11420 [Siccirubricoccus sp. KC 17139]|uniref:J domain-containing protein n=1 Tax=Siccirubricoccus soli TaxID=2899147 RepID=A0ABT1D4A7_9PROT|nr:hypothetical protein [Siccirubricoccus soli]MCO6416763.1 hypothetical protein [Siccirubricoccus soli]MCP2682898.1 hypothetical protein [Siccirubricoccus soli]
MLWLALGALVLLLLLLLAQGFARARVETIRTIAIGVAAAAALGLVALVLLSGRAMSVLWSLLMFAPVLLPRVRGWWANQRFRRRPDGAAGESSVETATLAMRVALDSGEMSGRVKRGPQAGRELAELGLAELLALLAECRASDPESVPLLEAWLDRVAPDWRQAEEATPPPAGRSGKMTRAEALEVLGLAEGASEAEIRAAHRRLMRGAHPDQGGSDWLAARINQARDVLLG